jgi:hypothetical protein
MMTARMVLGLWVVTHSRVSDWLHGAYAVVCGPYRGVINWCDTAKERGEVKSAPTTLVGVWSEQTDGDSREEGTCM